MPAGNPHSAPVTKALPRSVQVSIVKPGRIPISIVLSEMSKRKTPALVRAGAELRLAGVSWPS